MFFRTVAALALLALALSNPIDAAKLIFSRGSIIWEWW